MALKEKIVQGAICICKFGTTPDSLKVLTHSKHYLNDYQGSQKLAATHKDVGATFQANTFGLCTMQPTLFSYKPCQALVTAWSGYYEKVKYDPPGGFTLLEDSKGSCPIGGKDCISFVDSGQIGEPSLLNIRHTDSELQAHVNPMVDLCALDFEDAAPNDFLNIS